MADPINLIGDIAVRQGKDYAQVILWPNDLTGCTLEAIARDNTKRKGGVEQFRFAFLGIEYPFVNSKGVNCSVITLVLSHAVTEDIKETIYQGNTADLRIGFSSSKGLYYAYPWDLEITYPNGLKDGLDVGFIQVKPEVT